MAFEPIYDVVAMNGRQKLCSDQIVVEARLIPPQAASISKILTIYDEVEINASECFAGEARYTGKVTFKVLFVCTEGSNYCMEFTTDFQDKLLCEEITQNLRPEFLCRILDTDIISVSGQELKLAAVVEVDLFRDESVKVKYLASGGENIYTGEESMEYCKLISEGTSSFTVTASLNNVRATRLLMSQPFLITHRRYISGDAIVVEGKAVANLILEGADGMLLNHRIETPFSQETGVLDAAQAELAYSSLRLESFFAAFDGDGEGGGITLDFNIHASVRAYGYETIKIVADAFSITNEITTTTQSILVKSSKLCMDFEDRIEGNVTLDVSMPLVDNILAISAQKMHISNAFCGDGVVTVEGIVTASVIYYSAELNSKNSVAIELPFSLSFPCTVKSHNDVLAQGMVDEIIVKIRRGNELDIKAMVSVSLFVSEGREYKIISDIAIGDEIIVPDNAISIHIAKANETLWEVAKALCSTPELILLQNPLLTLPLAGGERIMIYRHLV